NAVEDITTGEETTKHLIVQRVQPFAADLDVVSAGNDREVVFRVRAPKKFIDVWFEEERKTKPERGSKPHRRISRNVRRNRRTWPQFTTIREVSFVQFCRRERGDEIHSHDVDLRWTFNTVG